jgi:2-phosphosulfolactate phosphatase
MKIDLYFTANEVTEDRLKDQIAVVVDVLRASTTICAALAAFAKEVVPVVSIADAIQLANQLSRDSILLCGEREGKLIEGFDLGNSPFQYTSGVVKGKTLIFGSTNGSPTIIKTRQASRTLINGFVNLGVVVHALMKTERSVSILCAGKLSQFAIEDAVCAGMLLDEVKRRAGVELELNDAASSAIVLAERYRDSIPELVAHSHHGKYLAEIGMEKDLPFCADLNRLPLLPTYSDGKITMAKE